MGQDTIKIDDIFMLASQRWNTLTDEFNDLAINGTGAEIASWLTKHRETIHDQIPTLVSDLLRNPGKCRSGTLPVLACRYIDLWWALSRHAEVRKLDELSTALYQKFDLILQCIYYINTLDAGKAFYEYRVVEVLDILYNYGLNLVRIAESEPEEIELWDNALEIFELALGFIESYRMLSPNEYAGGQVDYSISWIAKDPTIDIFTSELHLQIIHIQIIMSHWEDQEESTDPELLGEIMDIVFDLETCISFMQLTDNTMLTKDNATITLAQALLVSCYALIVFNQLAEQSEIDRIYYPRLQEQVNLTIQAYTRLEYNQQLPELSAVSYIIFPLARRMVMGVAAKLSDQGDNPDTTSIA